MKRLLFLFAIFCTILTSCRAQNPFQAIADMDDVQTVYVGKAVMKLAKGIDLGDQALNKMTGNLDSVLVMNISNKKAAQKAREMVKEYVEQNGLEQLLAATEKDESTTIFGRASDDGENISDMLLYTTEPGESNLILIKGKISMEQIGQLAGKSSD
jgi:hypothetical protein